jgi:hypothetical protein
MDGLGRAAYQLSHHAGKYEAKATAVRVTGRGEEACECAAKLTNPAIEATRPREDFGPNLRQTATSNNPFVGFSAAGNQSVGIAFDPIFEHEIDLPANSFEPLVRSRERLVRKSLRSDTPMRATLTFCHGQIPAPI